MTNRRRMMLSGVVAVALLGGAAWGARWWSSDRFLVATNDAYVRADVTSIAPKVAGYVSEVLVSDNAAVSPGQVLFRIDDSDYRARVAQAQANLAAKQAAIADLDSQARLEQALVQGAAAQVTAARAEADRAGRDSDRYGALLGQHWISRQKFETVHAGETRARASVVAAQAGVKAELRKLDVLAAGRQAAEAQVAQAKAALQLAELDLEHTVVRAPVAGVVGNRQVRVGRYVTPGAPVLDVVPVADVWVVANFKETQLGRLRAGEPVRVTVDSEPGVRLTGRIDSLAPGSGAAFSLLPPDNATGNFIRVVQRVPVKIRLTRNPPESRLVPGLSVRVSVDASPKAAPGGGAQRVAWAAQRRQPWARP